MQHNSYHPGMNKHDLIEEDIAYQLISIATEAIEASVDNMEDWDASVCAVLARAFELANGRQLKEIDDVFFKQLL